jgi:hypothetical protein
VTRWRRPGANEILRFSRMILIIVSCASCAVTAFAVARLWDLLKDCAQWALASTSVLYLAWLRPTASPNPSD